MDRRRAIVFDLDDTLYPYHLFVRSGFRVVAQHLADARGLSSRAVMGVVRRSLAGGGSGREVQELCAHFDLPEALVPALVAMIRDHPPRLRLPRASAHVLSTLRQTWRVGILTNGHPAVQRRKLAALGLAGLVDEALCAAECGDPLGKPSAAVFRTALARLGAEPAQTVFVGDDLRADIDGARAVGMKAIHITAPRLSKSAAGVCGCDVHIHRISEVPGIAEQMVPSRIQSHAW